VCALSAILAKEIMNVYTWTLSGVHTPASFLAVASAALPFDIADAVASFAFGLAFGPELARLLGRVRARMTVTWEREPAHPTVRPVVAPVALALLVAAGVLASSLPARAHGAVSPSQIARSVAYLRHAQNPDGGFGGASSQRSSELFSAWAAIGLAAAGQDPLTLRHGGFSVLDSIRAEADTLQGAGDLERTILALQACGTSTRELPGGDPVTRLLRYRSSDGSFRRLVNLTAFAILALRAAGEPADMPAVRVAARWLAHQQNPDGGFGYAIRGSASDVDDTGAALQAVVAASVADGPVVSGAVGYLAGAQNGDGGYPQERGGPSNAQSTAWAVQGLIAAGRDPGSVRRGRRSPLDYLQGLMLSDGSVRYSATSSQTPVWVTGEALAAMAGKPLPVAAPESAAGEGIGSGSTIATVPRHRRPAPTRGKDAGSATTGKPAGGLLALLAGEATSPRGREEALARGAGALIAIVLSPALG
jgi:energy-coupling factor transport system substrate-specific component